MTNINIRKLGQRDAWNIMFANTKFVLPADDDPNPPQAAPEARFSQADNCPPLQIDQAVKRIRTLSPEKLVARKILCLHYAARAAAADAAAQAHYAQEIGGKDSHHQMAYLTPPAQGRYFRKIQKEAKTLAREMRAFLKNKPQYDLNAMLNGRSSAIDVNAHKAIAMALAKVADAADALDGTGTVISQIAPSLLPRGAKGDLWSIRFVIVLGQFYRRITDKNPYYGDPFIRLVEAAWRDLGGRVGFEWESPIKTAIAKMKAVPNHPAPSLGDQRTN